MRPNDLKQLASQKGRRERNGQRVEHPVRAVVFAPILDLKGAGSRRESTLGPDAPDRTPQARLEEAVGLAAAIDLDMRASGGGPGPQPKPATG